MRDVDEFFAKLDAMGEEEVVKGLFQGVFGNSGNLVNLWLQNRERDRAAQLRVEQIAREERAVKAAEDANKLSAEANRWSLASFWVSGGSLVVAAVALIASLTKCS